MTNVPKRMPAGQVEDDDLGRIVGLVRTDERFAGNRLAFSLLQDVVAGLKRMRQRAGLNQTEMAKVLGITQGRVSQIESGLADHAPSLEMIARYAAVCEEHPWIRFSGDLLLRRRRGSSLIVSYEDQPHLADSERTAMEAAIAAHPDDVSLTESGDALRVSGDIAEEIEQVLVDKPVAAAE